MKKLLLVTLVALCSVAQANAAREKRSAPVREAYHPAPAAGQNMAGCGLGSMAIHENTKWMQVVAAFLNGTGVQTFGITTGTSNCTEDGVATASREKDAFVEANIADIRRDLSTGSGEYLSSLASFYGCKGAQVDTFGRALRKHQDQVGGANAEGASRVIDSVVSEEHASCLNG